MSWCLLESDPGVFTELVTEFGAEDVQVEELYSLDDSCLDHIRPIHGLIFLFKWEKEQVEDRTPYPNTNNEVFFASQVITNACATQALLSILLNNEDIKIGEFLSNFKEFTKDFPPDVKGAAFGDEKFRSTHNSFARAEMMVMEEKQSDGSDADLFHFIAYVPVKGRVFEIDGLKPGPYDLGPRGDDWVRVARPEIEKRIQKFSSGEIRFNLMGLVQSQKTVFLKKIEQLEKLEKTSDIENEINDLKQKISREEDKLENYKRENILRKHNYVPFVINLLQALSKNGELEKIIEEEKAKVKAK